MSFTIVQAGTPVAFANSGATITATLNGVVSGNTLILLSALYRGATPPTATVNDGTALTLAVRAAVTKTDSCSAASMHYRHNVTSGTHNIGVTTDSGAGERFGWALPLEVNGLVNAAPNRTGTNNADSANPTVSLSADTTVADCVIFSYLSIGQDGSDASIDVPAATGYTNLMVKQDITAEMGGAFDYKIVSATGPQSSAYGTLSGSMAWAFGLAAFEITTGGGGGTINTKTTTEGLVVLDNASGIIVRPAPPYGLLGRVTKRRPG